MDRDQVSVMAMAPVPRLGFTAHHDAVLTSLVPLGLHLQLLQGVFWHQELEKRLEWAIECGTQWALILDFDSLFFVDHVKRLLSVFHACPNIDALAALQAGRGGQRILAVADGDPVSNELGLLPVKTAHFGLTLLRLERFANLPKPWLHAVPAPNGGWGKGHKDSDIAFWLQWKEAGHNLFIDTGCRIGHLELQVLYVGDNNTVETMRVRDWQRYERQRLDRLAKEPLGTSTA